MNTIQYNIIIDKQCKIIQDNTIQDNKAIQYKTIADKIRQYITRQYNIDISLPP